MTVTLFLTFFCLFLLLPWFIKRRKEWKIVIDCQRESSCIELGRSYEVLFKRSKLLQNILLLFLWPWQSEFPWWSLGCEQGKAEELTESRVDGAAFL